MRTEDLGAFVAAMAQAAEIHQRDLSEAGLAAYADVLAEYPLESVLAAIRAHLGDPEAGMYFPKPADLVRLIQGRVQDRAVLAFDAAWKAVGTVGAYQSVDFGDPVIHRVLSDMGGWPEVCRTWLTEERPFREKAFCDRYRAWARRGQIQALPHLPGVVELENGGRYPWCLPAPVRCLAPSAGLGPGCGSPQIGPGRSPGGGEARRPRAEVTAGPGQGEIVDPGGA